MKDILARHQVPGATVAITRAGRLVLARGYGWADVENRRVMQPKSRFVLASVSKAITSAAAMKLVEQGRLKLDDRAFELLGEIRSPSGTTPDPRLKQITVQMLMHHAGGCIHKRVRTI
jgi:N-acyl-D-amino-acid deacylase